MTKHSGTITLLSISVLLQVLISLWPPLMLLLAFIPKGVLLFLTPITLLTSMVAHSSWGHLIGNYIFGLPAMLYVEDKLGKKKFLDLFIACGLLGSMLQMLCGNSGGIGSSGAIFGIMAAACCMFGRNRIEHLIALSVLLCLFVPQIVMAPFGALVGIGFWCHIGGGLAGMLLTHRLYKPSEPPCKPAKKR